MTGRIYYSDSTIQVTDYWVKLNGTAYPVPDIKSATLSRVVLHPLSMLSRALAMSGWVLALGAALLYVITRSQGGDVSSVVWALGLIGLFNLALGKLIRVFRKPDYTYQVRLKGAFGNVAVLGTRDLDYAERVVEDINMAVRYYRRLSRKTA
jgi:hypothetical protein